MLRRRGWPVVAVLAIVACAGLAVVMLPSLGARYVRSRILPRAEERLGRRVTLGDLRIGWGHVELSELVVDGAGAPAPLTVPHATAYFRVAPLLSGRVELTRVVLQKPRITVVRSETGDDNVSSLLERLRGHGEAPAADAHAGRLSGPDEVELQGGVLSLSDDSLGTVEVGAFDATMRRHGAGHATLGDVELTLAAGPSARARKVSVDFGLDGAHLTGLPSLAVEGGDVRIWKGFAVSGIQGGIAPDASEPARLTIDLRGGYGGVDKVLWSAKGWADPKARAGAVQLIAKRFDLGQLAPILAGTPIVDPGHAEVDAHLDLTYHTVTDLPTVTPDTAPKIVPGPPPHLSPRAAREARLAAATRPPPEPQPAVPAVAAPREVLDFDGGFHLSGLSLFHPDLAPAAVRNLRFDGSARGRLEPKARSVRVERADLDVQGVKVAFALAAWNLGKKRDGKRPIDRFPAFRARLAVAPVPCQTALAAIPAELVPALQGFQLQGMFKSDVQLAIDPDDLDSLELVSDIGIDGCKVIQAPAAFAAARLQEPFRQAVEIEPGSWIAFDVGPDNPDWTPYADISPHLVNSIMTTEDSNFFHHHGFIGREFKSALRTNLGRGYFRLGASSITMQMIKNVLLSREKTYSRKLQEMFLTWYLEHTLTKERILEIYFNVIEFGPGIYGIGRAARHYFGKAAKDLQPREAAWFSSILPNPKRRYAHYCRGAPDLKWELYLNRILRTMHGRGRLTDEEATEALDARLTFDRAEAMPTEKCLEMVRRLTAQQRGTQVAAGVEVRASEAPLVPDDAPPEDDTDDAPEAPEAPGDNHEP